MNGTLKLTQSRTGAIEITLNDTVTENIIMAAFITPEEFSHFLLGKTGGRCKYVRANDQEVSSNEST